MLCTTSWMMRLLKYRALSTECRAFLAEYMALLIELGQNKDDFVADIVVFDALHSVMDGTNPLNIGLF